MHELQVPKFHVTESDGSLQIRLTRGSYMLRVSSVIGVIVALGASVFAATTLGLYAISCSFWVIVGAPLWISHLMAGLWILLLLPMMHFFGHVLDANKRRFRHSSLLGLRPLTFDRRSDRIIYGRDEVGSLDGFVEVGIGHADGRDLHVVSIVFLDDADCPHALEGRFRRADEAERFARRVAEFIGVPVVEFKKAGANSNLNSLADDTLVGDLPRAGG